MSDAADLAIVGGGPAGALLAILAARRGRKVVLVERRGDPRSTTPEAGRSINLALAAKRDVSVTVAVDGETETFTMRIGETRSFMAKQSLLLQLADGASLHIVVNGTDLGVPGHAGRPWMRTWTSDTGASPSTSP